MVRIINYKKLSNENGESFFALELQGGVEMVKSRQTDRYYVTARKTVIPSTFDEDTCVSLIGSELPGEITKVETEAYEYTIKETGEVLTLSHRYEYVPENFQEPIADKSHSTIEDFVKIDNATHDFSTNGVM
jgi:hypothetical protein